MDSVVKLVSVAATVIVSLGGFEFVKWVVTRKYGKRVDEAEADKSEFSTLREQIVFLQEQLLKKEEIILFRAEEMLTAVCSMRAIT